MSKRIDAQADTLVVRLGFSDFLYVNQTEAERLVDVLEQQLCHIGGDAVTVADVELSSADGWDLIEEIKRGLSHPSRDHDWRKLGF